MVEGGGKYRPVPAVMGRRVPVPDLQEETTRQTGELQTGLSPIPRPESNVHSNALNDQRPVHLVIRRGDSANAGVGFEQRIPITQALLQANDNANRGLRHTAFLDLEKAYDKINREALVEVAKQWLHTDELNMVRAMLSPLRVQIKSDPTNCTATVTRSVPQGDPSSPVLFNTYIDKLATRAEPTTQARLQNSAIFMLSDDVLLQVRMR